MTFSGGATGTVTKATATTLVVTGLSGLTVGPLAAIVTSNSISSASAIQVATVIPVVTASTMSLDMNAPSLIINGFGFDPTSGNNIVSFGNGVTGTVSNATANQLTVTNLSGLALGVLKASVNVDGQNSGTAVQVATVKPVVTASQTTIAASSTTLIIQGFGFSAAAAENIVMFSDGAKGRVTNATPTQLTVTGLRGLAAGSLSASVTVRTWLRAVHCRIRSQLRCWPQRRHHPEPGLNSGSASIDAQAAVFKDGCQRIDGDRCDSTHSWPNAP